MEDRVRLRVKDLMEERGLTQMGLSEKTGIRQAAISSLVRGNVERLAINHIKRIASALGIEDINEIITLDVISE